MQGPASTTPESANRMARGARVRQTVLGPAHVERSTAALTPFGQPLRDLVNEFCWGEVWSRPGLELKQRSLLNIGILTALGRSRELAIHLQGALNTGLSPTEIQEAVLQTAVYCGVPAALEAMRIATEVLSGAAREDSSEDEVELG